MPPQILSLAIFGIEELIKQAPALAAEFQTLFASGQPTAADFAALRAKVLGESYADFVPASAIGTIPPVTDQAAIDQAAADKAAADKAAADKAAADKAAADQAAADKAAADQAAADKAAADKAAAEKVVRNCVLCGAELPAENPAANCQPQCKITSE